MQLTRSSVLSVFSSLTSRVGPRILTPAEIQLLGNLLPDLSEVKAVEERFQADPTLPGLSELEKVLADLARVSHLKRRMDCLLLSTTLPSAVGDALERITLLHTASKQVLL